MTHKELVERASKWLRNKLHCRVVLAELVAYTPSRETPDAIGWIFNRSILIECKTNKADYYANRRKVARRSSGRALGHWRFYLTEMGVLDGIQMPMGWGLYEIQGKRVCYKSGLQYANAAPPPFQSDRDSEVAMLVSALAKNPRPMRGIGVLLNPRIATRGLA